MSDLGLLMADGSADFARDEAEAEFRCHACGFAAARLTTVDERLVCDCCRGVHNFAFAGYLCVCGRVRPGKETH